MLLVEGLEVSNNLTGLAPDDLFRPTFTRESANCVKMSKIIRQKSEGEVMTFLTSNGKTYYEYGLARTYTSLMKNPELKLWFDYSSEKDDLPVLSQSHGAGFNVLQQFGDYARPAGSEIKLKKTVTTRMMKPTGTCDYSPFNKFGPVSKFDNFRRFSE